MIRITRRTFGFLSASSLLTGSLAGGGVALIGTTLVPLLANLFG